MSQPQHSVKLRYSCNEVGIKMEMFSEQAQRYALIYIKKWEPGLSFDAFVDADVKRIREKNVEIKEVLRVRD